MSLEKEVVLPSSAPELHTFPPGLAGTLNVVKSDSGIEKGVRRHCV